jgi:hypothetical protein
MKEVGEGTSKSDPRVSATRDTVISVIWTVEFEDATWSRSQVDQPDEGMTAKSHWH